MIEVIRKLRRDMDGVLSDIREIKRRLGKFPVRFRAGGSGGGINIPIVSALPELPTDGKVHIVFLQTTTVIGNNPAPDPKDQIWWWGPGQTQWRPAGGLFSTLPGTPGTVSRP